MSAPTLHALSLSPICVSINKSVELKFRCVGKPEPVISWSFNGEKIEPSLKFETLASGDEFTLIVHEVSLLSLWDFLKKICKTFANLNKFTGSKTRRRHL